jgi:hypothetical protein
VIGFVDCVQMKERRAAGARRSVGNLRPRMPASNCCKIVPKRGVREVRKGERERGVPLTAVETSGVARICANTAADAAGPTRNSSSWECLGRGRKKGAREEF